MNRKLIVRLAGGAIAIAMVLGLAVFLWEIEKVDNGVVARATAESASFARQIGPDLERGDAAARTAIQWALAALVADHADSPAGHFVLAETYDAQRRSLAEAGEIDGRIEAEANRHTHEFPALGEVWYQRLVVKRQIYLQVMIPLADGSGRLAGWFEGVYQVAPASIAEIRADVATMLIMVVAVVLATALLLYPIIRRQHRSLEGLTHGLLQANIETLKVLGGAIAKRDSDTHAHNFRVSIMAVRLAERIGLAPAAIRGLIKGAFLHDVGKIAISDTILLKPGRLDAAEFDVMKTHVVHGIDIVRSSDWLVDAVPVVRSHHEKFDGSGYTQGLAGPAIPTEARIFAIADVFDALTSRRPYKEPLPLDATLAILEEGRGRHFDPELLDAFMAIAADLHRDLAGREDDGIAAVLDAITNRYFHQLA